jgi:hypothetical protein
VVGVLYIRDSVSLEPLIHGASHESGRRAGTENVLLDVALGAACDLGRTWRGMDSVRELRDLFWELLQNKFGDQVVLNGHPTERLPNTLNVSFVAQSGAEVLGRLPGEAALPALPAIPDRWNCPQSCKRWESRRRSEWARFGLVSAVQRPGQRSKLWLMTFEERRFCGQQDALGKGLYDQGT